MQTKSKREHAWCGEPYAFGINYCVLALSLTLAVFNTDIIPFFVSVFGFKLGMDGLLVVMDADEPGFERTLRWILTYGFLLGGLGSLMSFTQFGYVCAQYERLDDLCAGAPDILSALNIDFQNTTVRSCSNKVSGTSEILQRCRDAFLTKYMLFLIIALLYIALSTSAMTFGVRLDRERAVHEETAVDSEKDILDSTEFIGSRALFPVLRNR